MTPLHHHKTGQTTVFYVWIEMKLTGSEEKGGVWDGKGELSAGGNVCFLISAEFSLQTMC